MLSSELGNAVPRSCHAVSVELPKWKHVVGYEEGSMSVVGKMEAGYPRFRYPNDVVLIHSVLRALHYFYGKVSGTRNTLSIQDIHSTLEIDCAVLQNEAIASRLMDFIGEPLCMYSIGSLAHVAVFFSTQHSRKAKLYWQHCGENISSREAADILVYLQSDLLSEHVAFSWWQPPVDEVYALDSWEALQQRVVVKISANTRCLEQFLLVDPAAPKASPMRSSCPRRVSILRTIGKLVEEVPEFLSTNRGAKAVIPDTSASQRHAVVALTEESTAEASDTCSNMLLLPTGMAAIFTALRLALKLHASRLSRGTGNSVVPQVVVFGFPYLDTLKMMQRVELNPGGVVFLGHGGSSDLAQLEQFLKSSTVCNCPAMDPAPVGDAQYSSREHGDGAAGVSNIAAIFTEFPSNPLLRCPDLIRLTALARQYGVLLVVDDTVANFANVDLLHSPDVQVGILCTSLTKIFSGHGDAMGGSLVVNSLSPHSAALQSLVREMHATQDLPQLYSADAAVIDVHSRGFLERSHRSNCNPEALARWLQEHPAVHQVYYPGVPAAAAVSGESDTRAKGALRILHAVQRRNPLSFHPAVDSSRGAAVAGSATAEGGFQPDCGLKESFSTPQEVFHLPGKGCLLSFVLKPGYSTQVFYDCLELHKGPSLGTEFTLVCPYALLAHYHELDWAAQYDVQPDLIRVSVGVEPIEVIIKKFADAMDAAFV